MVEISSLGNMNETLSSLPTPLGFLKMYGGKKSLPLQPSQLSSLKKKKGKSEEEISLKGGKCPSPLPPLFSTWCFEGLCSIVSPGQRPFCEGCSRSLHGVSPPTSSQQAPHSLLKRLPLSNAKELFGQRFYPPALLLTILPRVSNKLLQNPKTMRVGGEKERERGGGK